MFINNSIYIINDNTLALLLQDKRIYSLPFFNSLDQNRIAGILKHRPKGCCGDRKGRYEISSIKNSLANLLSKDQSFANDLKSFLKNQKGMHNLQKIIVYYNIGNLHKKVEV